MQPDDGDMVLSLAMMRGAEAAAVTVGCVSDWHGGCRKRAGPTWFVECRCNFSRCGSYPD